MAKSALNHQATVSARYYFGAYEFAQNICVEKSIDTYWLENYIISGEQTRISARRYQSLLESASTCLNEPCFGLNYGQQIDIAAFSLLGYLAMASATLKEASEAVNQYGGLVSEIGRLDSEIITEINSSTNPPLVKIYWRPRPGNENCSGQVIDGVLAGWVNFGREFIGENTKIHSVHLTRRRASETSYRKFFDCPVVIGDKVNYICIEQTYFEKKLLKAEPLVHQIIQEKANQAVQEIENQKRLASDYISDILPGLIFSGKTNIENIATLLNTSARSLQRKLEQENTNYRDLVDNARRALAIKLLRENEYPLSHISGIIGFNDQSSFTRAFKRWTKVTPKQYQASL